jgi:hypothetical protein
VTQLVLSTAGKRGLGGSRHQSYVWLVTSNDDLFGLRLAANGADREKAAREQWPAFEEHLKRLGYSPRLIMRAFCVLSGPGTVAEALQALKDTPNPNAIRSP